MEKTLKTKIIERNQTHKNDCGSRQVVEALLLERINLLNAHMKKNPKDLHTRKGLLALVKKRKKIIKELKQNDKRQ